MKLSLKIMCTGLFLLSSNFSYGASTQGDQTTPNSSSLCPVTNPNSFITEKLQFVFIPLSANSTLPHDVIDKAYITPLKLDPTKLTMRHVRDIEAFKKITSKAASSNNLKFGVHEESGRGGVLIQERVSIDFSKFNGGTTLSSDLSNLIFPITSSEVSMIKVDSCPIENVPIVFSLLEESLPSLERLVIHSNNPSFLAQYIFPNLSRLKNLQSLNLSNNNIGPDEAHVLAPVLAQLTGLQKLDLSYNNLGDDGVKFLNPAFQALPHLQILDLDSNEIGNAGIEELTSAFTSLSNLRELDLGTNNVGDNGVNTLASLLHHVPYLKELCLSANSIQLSDETIKSLALSLVPLTEFKTLKLMGMCPGFETCNFLREEICIKKIFFIKM